LLLLVLLLVMMLLPKQPARVWLLLGREHAARAQRPTCEATPNARSRGQGPQATEHARGPSIRATRHCKRWRRQVGRRRPLLLHPGGQGRQLSRLQHLGSG
jgi:hypothetical protein